MAPPIRLPPTLSDGDILLDGHAVSDAEAHLAGEDAEMIRRFDAPRQATLEEMRASIQRWIDARAAGGPNFCYALRTPDGVLMGGCEVRWLTDVALNLSYWCFPQFRGQGFVARAVALMLEAVPVTGARRIEAHVDADNIASRHVAERAGFTQDGTVVDDAFTGGKLTRIRYVKFVP